SAVERAAQVLQLRMSWKLQEPEPASVSALAAAAVPGRAISAAARAGRSRRPASDRRPGRRKGKRREPGFMGKGLVGCSAGLADSGAAELESALPPLCGY